MPHDFEPAGAYRHTVAMTVTGEGKHVKAHRGFVGLLSLASLFLAPAAVVAQTQPGSLPVFVGQKLRITVEDGRTIEGKVSERAQDSITLGATRIATNDIRRVQVRDGLGDGASKGAALFGLLGALAGIAAESIADSFGGTTSNGSGFLAGIGIGLAGGAAIGAVLDAMQNKTIYERGEKAMSVAVRPIVSNAGKGVGLTVRW